MSALFRNVDLGAFYDIYRCSPTMLRRSDATTTAHSGLMTAISRLVRARWFVELGTGTGIGTRAFLACARETEGHVWSIDHEERLGKAELEGDPQATFLIGDTVEIGRGWDTADHPGPGGGELPDVVYVDSDHSYAHALAELRVWSQTEPKVIFADDTLDPNLPYGSPLQAVHDFCAESGWRYVNVPIATGLAVLLPSP